MKKAVKTIWTADGSQKKDVVVDSFNALSSGKEIALGSATIIGIGAGIELMKLAKDQAEEAKSRYGLVDKKTSAKDVAKAMGLGLASFGSFCVSSIAVGIGIRDSYINGAFDAMANEMTTMIDLGLIKSDDPDWVDDYKIS